MTCCDVARFIHVGQIPNATSSHRKTSSSQFRLVYISDKHVHTFHFQTQGKLNVPGLFTVIIPIYNPADIDRLNCYNQRGLKNKS